MAHGEYKDKNYKVNFLKKNYTYITVSLPKGDLDYVMLRSYLRKNCVPFSVYARKLIQKDMENTTKKIDIKEADSPFAKGVTTHKVTLFKGSPLEEWVMSHDKKSTYIRGLIQNDIQKNKELYYK